MPDKQPTTVADLEGAWVDPEFDSGLIQRCKQGWNIPVNELTNELLSTFLRQKIALAIILPEAKKRVATNFTDDSELYDEELEAAIRFAEKHH